MPGNEELERYKRFQAKQYSELGSKVVALQKMIQNYSPGKPIAPHTKDLLGRQVEMMFQKIRFIEVEIIKIKKHLGIKDG